MTFGQKIKKLRNDNGLTQEQFAEKVYVSRTAISKWESDKGYPSIDSLKYIAEIFNVSIDDLLSNNEIIDIAQNENNKNISRFVTYINAIFNIVAVLVTLLPLYKVEQNNMFYSVPLYQFKSWLAVFYWIFPVAMAICGIIQILINKGEREKLKNGINIISGILNISAIFILILSGQPYPSIVFFTLLLIKSIITLIKRK